MSLFGSILTDTLTLPVWLACFAAALVCGGIIAFSMSFKGGIGKGFAISLVLLPPIVSTVIAMVNGSVGTGIAVAGAFSLVRFRSSPGKARDLVAVFLAMTAGLTCAAGYVGIAILLTVLVSACGVLLSLLPMKRDSEYLLKITVPETLEFGGAFTDLFEKYARSWKTVRVKTVNMGSLYRLFYRVDLKDPASAKEMIDAIRCRNGNLEISLGSAGEEKDEL